MTQEQQRERIMDRLEATHEMACLCGLAQQVLQRQRDNPDCIPELDPKLIAILQVLAFSAEEWKDHSKQTEKEFHRLMDRRKGKK